LIKKEGWEEGLVLLGGRLLPGAEREWTPVVILTTLMRGCRRPYVRLSGVSWCCH